MKAKELLKPGKAPSDTSNLLAPNSPCQGRHGHDSKTIRTPRSSPLANRSSYVRGSAPVAPRRVPRRRPLTSQAGAAGRLAAAEEKEAAVEGVVPARQRRVHLQQEGERAAAARARQRPGPRQLRQAQPRRPPAHFAGKLLAAQPPGRCLLGEAQLHRNRGGGSHARGGTLATRPEGVVTCSTGRKPEGVLSFSPPQLQPLAIG